MQKEMVTSEPWSQLMSEYPNGVFPVRVRFAARPSNAVVDILSARDFHWSDRAWHGWAVPGELAGLIRDGGGIVEYDQPAVRPKSDLH